MMSGTGANPGSEEERLRNVAKEILNKSDSNPDAPHQPCAKQQEYLTVEVFGLHTWFAIYLRIGSVIDMISKLRSSESIVQMGKDVFLSTLKRIIGSTVFHLLHNGGLLSSFRALHIGMLSWNEWAQSGKKMDAMSVVVMVISANKVREVFKDKEEIVSQNERWADLWAMQAVGDEHNPIIGALNGSPFLAIRMFRWELDSPDDDILKLLLDQSEVLLYTNVVALSIGMMTSMSKLDDTILFLRAVWDKENEAVGEWEPAEYDTSDTVNSYLREWWTVEIEIMVNGRRVKRRVCIAVIFRAIQCGWIPLHLKQLNESDTEEFYNVDITRGGHLVPHFWHSFVRGYLTTVLRKVKLSDSGCNSTDVNSLFQGLYTWIEHSDPHNDCVLYSGRLERLCEILTKVNGGMQVALWFTELCSGPNGNSTSFTIDDLGGGVPYQKIIVDATGNHVVKNVFQRVVPTHCTKEDFEGLLTALSKDRGKEILPGIVLESLVPELDAVRQYKLVDILNNWKQ